MTDYILTLIFTMILVSLAGAVVIICWLLKSIHNINIIIKQEFSDSDRQLLEDLYNQDGELKDKRETQMLEALDGAVRSINNIMLGTTVSAMLMFKDEFYIVHVGDSRVYELTDSVRILTKDQTFVAREIAEEA